MQLKDKKERRLRETNLIWYYFYPKKEKTVAEVKRTFNQLR